MVFPNIAVGRRITGRSYGFEDVNFDFDGWRGRSDSPYQSWSPDGVFRWGRMNLLPFADDTTVTGWGVQPNATITHGYAHGPFEGTQGQAHRYQLTGPGNRSIFHGGTISVQRPGYFMCSIWVYPIVGTNWYVRGRVAGSGAGSSSDFRHSLVLNEWQQITITDTYEAGQNLGAQFLGHRPGDECLFWGLKIQLLDPDKYVGRKTSLDPYPSYHAYGWEAPSTPCFLDLRYEDGGRGWYSKGIPAIPNVTNRHQNNRDHSTAVGTNVSMSEATGMDGETRTIRISEGNGSTSGHATWGWTIADNERIIYQWWLKRQSVDSDSWAHFSISAMAGGSAMEEGAYVNPNDGTVNRTDTQGSTEIERFGEWFRITQRLTNNVFGNGSGDSVLRARVYPARSNDGLSDNGTHQGFVDVDFIMMERDPVADYPCWPFETGGVDLAGSGSIFQKRVGPELDTSYVIASEFELYEEDVSNSVTCNFWFTGIDASIEVGDINHRHHLRWRSIDDVNMVRRSEFIRNINLKTGVQKTSGAVVKTACLIDEDESHARDIAGSYEGEAVVQSGNVGTVTPPDLMMLFAVHTLTAGNFYGAMRNLRVWDDLTALATEDEFIRNAARV